MVAALRNGSPERKAQCRAAGRLGGLRSGAVRRRRKHLRPWRPRARVNRTGPGYRPIAKLARIYSSKNASAPRTPKDQDLDQDLRSKAASESAAARSRRAGGPGKGPKRPKPHTPDPFRHPIRTLRAVAYRGLDHRIDFGELREHLKAAASAVYGRPLTVADVLELDSILRQAEGHRRKLAGDRFPRRRQTRQVVAPEPVREPKEPPMSTEPDDDTRAFLAAVRDRAARAAVAPAPAPRPAPAPAAPLVKTPPDWIAGQIVECPKDFKARVRERRQALALPRIDQERIEH